MLDAEAVKQGNKWLFTVTLYHTDEGWNHYADGWGVYDLNGNELGYRTLAHPHVNEMPFTRSLANIAIPQELSEVIIKPRDSIHGVGESYLLVLPN